MFFGLLFRFDHRENTKVAIVDISFCLSLGLALIFF